LATNVFIKFSVRCSVQNSLALSHCHTCYIYGDNVDVNDNCCKGGSAAAWRLRSNSVTCYTSDIRSSSHCHTCCIHAIGIRHLPAHCCCHKPHRRQRIRCFSV